MFLPVNVVKSECNQCVSWEGELEPVLDCHWYICQNRINLGFLLFFVKASFTDLQGGCHTCCGYKLWIQGWFQGLRCEWSQKICKHPGLGSFGRRWLMLPRVALSSSLSYSLFQSLCHWSEAVGSWAAVGLGWVFCSYCRLFKSVALMWVHERDEMLGCH